MTNKLDLHKIVEVLKNCLPKKDGSFPLHEPWFNGNEWKYVKECIDTGWVSSVGKFVEEFERRLVEFTGVKHAIAVVNGTAALHVCLKILGVESNDEVLIPALTFVATANAVTYCGAIPHFIDSDYRTLGVNPEKLESYLQEIAEVRKNECFNKKTGRRIKAIVPMHTFGHPVDLDRISEISSKFNFELIEDAAESLGSFYKGRHSGNWGKVSAISFNGNKIVTTGGGGAILTNDEELAKIAKHITTTAKVPHRWAFYHDQTGFNYRLPNLNAALGCAQLEQLPSFIAYKRNLAKRYEVAFRGVQGVSFFVEPYFAQSNYWLNSILLDDLYVDQRDELLQLTNQQGIMTRPAWTLLHKLPMYSNCPRMDLSIAESIEQRLINIPSSPSLGVNNVAP